MPMLGLALACMLTGLALAMPRSHVTGRAPRRTSWPRWTRPLLVGMVLTAAWQVEHTAAVLVLGLAAAGGLQLRARAVAARAAERRRQQVIDFGEALVGELQAGQPVVDACARALRVWPEAAPVAAAARLDADVPQALRRLGERPGAAGMRRLAAAWSLCAGTGAGLAFALDQVVQTARGEQEVARQVQAELAAARATGRLVTLLPVVVLLAAQGIGAQPWHFLTGTASGLVCLAGGLALTLTGLWWIERIGASAQAGQ